MNDVINNYFAKPNVGHAYLLKTEDYTKVVDIAKYIIKKNNIDEANIEKLIDENIYSDFKIIEPEGQWIKKEQIISLKDEFKAKSAYNNKRIYVIKNAENLNKSSGNTLLKFLEEPEDNIVALLITTNKNKVLDTLVSRCQYIVLDSNMEYFVSEDEKIIEFIETIENKKSGAAIEILPFLEGLNDKSEIKYFLIKVTNMYEQIMLKKLNIKDNKEEEMFDKIIKNNTIETVKKKIEALISIVDALEYNINMKLLVDKLIILMFGVD